MSICSVKSRFDGKKLFSVETEIEFFKDERKTREIENEVIKIAIPIGKRKPYHIIMS